MWAHPAGRESSFAFVRMQSLRHNTHVHAKPGSELGPSEARYHTVYQSADKLPCGCIFLFPLPSFQAMTSASALWLGGTRQLAGALDDFIYLFIQVPLAAGAALVRLSSSRHQSGGVKLKQSRRRRADRQ